MLDVLKVILLGIVEGITEWLPVSSTGHLILVGNVLKPGLSDAFMEMFNVVIQLGAIMAVVVLYFHKLNPFSPKKTQKQKLLTWQMWIKGPKKQVKLDKVFNPFEKPDVKEKYAVIVCDTAVLARMIGREYYEGAEASIVIDHHASNEGYGDVNYTKISEACAENVYYILNPVKLKHTVDCEIFV